MSESHWKSLILAALHRNRSDKGVRFLQLATVDVRNRPRNRTVVFRGFVDASTTIMLAVDSRSEKLDQLRQNPYAAICWYFSKTREQFRLAGKVTIVEADSPDREHQQSRLGLWGRLSEESKLLWYWPHPKGDRDVSLPFPSSPPADSLNPPVTFVLLLFDVDEVDRLQLRGNPQNRTLFVQVDGCWQTTSVNP